MRPQYVTPGQEAYLRRMMAAPDRTLHGFGHVPWCIDRLDFWGLAFFEVVGYGSRRTWWAWPSDKGVEALERGWFEGFGGQP